MLDSLGVLSRSYPVSCSVFFEHPDLFWFLPWVSCCWCLPQQFITVILYYSLLLFSAMLNFTCKWQCLYVCMSWLPPLFLLCVYPYLIHGIYTKLHANNQIGSLQNFKEFVKDSFQIVFFIKIILSSKIQTLYLQLQSLFSF